MLTAGAKVYLTFLSQLESARIIVDGCLVFGAPQEMQRH